MPDFFSEGESLVDRAKLQYFSQRGTKVRTLKYMATI